MPDDSRPIYETIIPTIRLIPTLSNESMINPLLRLVRTTALTKNHAAIISALENALANFPEQKKERWENDFAETIASVMLQQKKTENIIIYVANLSQDDLRIFFEDICRLFDFDPLGHVQISIKFDQDLQLANVRLTSSTNQLDNDFCQIGAYVGILNKFEWRKKFHRISGPPIAHTGAIKLINGDEIFFQNDLWWLATPSETDRREISRSDAFDLLDQSGMLSDISQESFDDLNA
jgi:hypothetical protein